MKNTILILSLLIATLSFSQIQIGADINGEVSGDRSGSSVSLSSDGSIMAIGAPKNDGNGINSGHVRVYQNIAGVWSQIGADIDGEVFGDSSGESVSLSNDGNIIAIGATDNDGNGYNSGHVRIYQNIAGTWTQIGADIDGEAANGYSGGSISLSGDGSIIAIGASLNNGSAPASGHVRIYQNINGVWSQIGTDIDGEASVDESGYSVSLSNDGSIVAIGALGNDGNGDNSGHVRIYQNTGGTWIQIGADIDGEAAGDRSGGSVSLSDDGNIVAIGARFNDGNGNQSGHVRVYQNITGTWTQIGADINGETAVNQSGISVSLSSNGTIVAIGAARNSESGNESGHVRIYQNTGGVWTQIGTDINGETPNDKSGTSVSLSSDGKFVAIGAPFNSGGRGHVRVFDLSSQVLSTPSEKLDYIKIHTSSNKNLHVAGIEKGNVKLKVFNILGKSVLNTSFNATNNNNIMLPKLSSGVYIIQLKTEKGTLNKKILIE